jgi:hypothetical protein
MSGQFHVPPALSPRKKSPALSGQEAGWVPELVWILWRKEKSVAPAKN